MDIRSSNPEDPEPCLIINRSADTDLADASMRWGPDRLAAHTSVDVGYVAGLPVWGFPSHATVLDLDATPCTFRFHALGSPFGGRTLSFDLAVESSAVATRPAAGPADLELSADWDPICAWLTEPDLLFGDVFPGAATLNGELAILSLFEGLVWDIGRRAGTSLAPLRRWAQLWASPAVRRDLASLARLGGEPTD